MKLSEAIAGLNTNVRSTLKALTQKQIETVITKLDAGYHDKGQGLVSDSVYDSVRRYLKKNYPESEFNGKIGGNRRDSELPVPMPSLNQFDVGSPRISKFFAKYRQCVASDKHDGLSLEIIYDSNGDIQYAFLRGDAETGSDVTRHLKALVHTIPQKAKPNLVVRGEAVLPLAAFNTHMHKDVGGDYKAARNAAAGLFNAARPTFNMKHLQFSAFAIIGGSDVGLVPSKQLKLLSSLGFTTIPHKLYTDLTEAKLQSLLESRIRKSGIEIDGLVINADVRQDTPSATNPKQAFKYKMNSEADSVLVTVTDIIYQLTKQGKYQPVIMYEPTTVRGGATIQRANGHNAFYIQNGYLKDEKDASKRVKEPIGIGAVIKVVRSGAVIPYVLEVIKASRNIPKPKGDYEYDGLHFVATDKDQSEIKTRVLLQTLKALNIKDAGPAICSALVHSGFDPLSLFKAKPADYLSIGNAASATLAKEITKVQTEGVSLAAAAHAVGQMYCDGLALSSWQSIVQAAAAKTVVDLTSIDSQVLASASIKKLAPMVLKAIPNIVKAIGIMGIKIKQPKTLILKNGSKLAGKKITFTGTRDQSLFDAAELAGALVQSMRKDTDILVAKDAGSGSVKLQKAEADGIKILSIDAFRKLL